MNPAPSPGPRDPLAPLHGQASRSSIPSVFQAAGHVARDRQGGGHGRGRGRVGVLAGVDARAADAAVEVGVTVVAGGRTCKHRRGWRGGWALTSSMPSMWASISCSTRACRSASSALRTPLLMRSATCLMFR